MATRICVASDVWNRRLYAFTVCALTVSIAVSCGRTQAVPPPIPINSVMQVVRQYGKRAAPHASITANPGGPTLTGDGPYDSDGPYQAHIAAMLAQSDFVQLEREAQQVRASKSRLKGGVWKLFAFYDGVDTPSPNSDSSNSDWEAHILAVKQWVAAYPNSATARIALAESYVNRGWAARGSGYSNTVSDSGWNLLREQTELAKSTLLDAARLEEKCPFWYESMQVIARDEGWPKQDMRTLFDEAVAFEPTYYHFYREYANTLLPKWYGEEGEIQAFAEDVSTRLGEPDGSIIYFEIASMLACQCDKEMDSLAKMSWPKVKKGYSDLQRLYGTSNLKMNRFAYMSVLSGDKISARETFLMLGDSWSEHVWPSAEHFETAKRWTSTP